MQNKRIGKRKATKNGLKKPSIDTLLTESLHHDLDDDFLCKLIKRRDCNVNKPYENGFSPLHLAIARSTSNVAHQLLKRGADMDALDEHQNTPLHRAVKLNNLEAVCLLLCYGADVSIPDNEQNTPIMNAVIENKQEIAERLVWFYADFSHMNACRETVLDIAMCTRSSLVANLVKAGAGREEYNTFLLFSLSLEDSELFEILWPKINLEHLLDVPEPFLLIYLKECTFSKQQFVKCFNLMLSSSIASDLVATCRIYDDHRLMFTTLTMFNKQHIEKNDRLSIIYILMSLGVPADIADIILTIETYGFGPEVEALMYVGQSIEEDFIVRKTFPLPACILAFEETTQREFNFNLLRNQCRLIYHVQYVLQALKYFSVPPTVKQQLRNISRKWPSSVSSKFCEKLDQVPAVPSLLELSRNQARKFVIDKFEVKKPYQFHDAVKRLDLPERVKDIIRFKAPLH